MLRSAVGAANLSKGIACKEALAGHRPQLSARDLELNGKHNHYVHSWSMYAVNVW